MFLSSARKVLILVYGLLVPVEVWAAVEVRLNPEIAVRNESVTLGEVATISGADGKDFAALSSLMITQFPAGQREMHLPASYLSRRIQETLGAKEMRLSAPSQILLRLRSDGIGEAELAGAIARLAHEEGKVPDWVESRVEISGGREALQDLKLTDVRIEAGAQAPRWKGDLTFKVSEIESGAAHWIRAKVRWFGHVWAAKRDLGIAQVPNPADFEISRVDLTNEREEAVGATESIEAALRGARYRRGIRSGAPLVKAALERKPDARTGQELKVVFVSANGIRVSADGSLVGSGAIGDEVRARLKSSRKVVVGKLVESGLVEVSL